MVEYVSLGKGESKNSMIFDDHPNHFCWNCPTPVCFNPSEKVGAGEGWGGETIYLLSINLLLIFSATGGHKIFGTILIALQ